MLYTHLNRRVTSSRLNFKTVNILIISDTDGSDKDLILECECLINVDIRASLIYLRIDAK